MLQPCSRLSSGGALRVHPHGYWEGVGTLEPVTTACMEQNRLDFK